MEQLFFAASHCDKQIAKASSSGGAFSAITDRWFRRYGAEAVIYGCALDEDLKAKHIRAVCPEERDRMRGSKYIGSDMSGVLRAVAEDLTQKKYVVFSGTPCQIAGLQAFLKATGIDARERLLTIEVICHGVSSVKFFDDYIRHLESWYRGKAVGCNFRTKKRPGKKQDMIVAFDNGKTYYAASTRYDWFYSAYLKDLILRPSCYQCRFAQRKRFADISIADHWGDAAGEHLARSLIIANTEFGAAWTQAAMQEMEYDEIRWDAVKQPHMKAPCKKPENHAVFWDTYRTGGYLAAQRLLGNNTVKGRMRSVMVYLLDRTRALQALKWLQSGIRKSLGK